MWLLQRIIYLSLILLAAVMGLVVRKNIDKEFKGVLLLLWITFLLESIAVWMAFHRQDNRFLYHLFNPVECTIWGYVYYRLFTNKTYKRLAFILASAVVLFMIISSVWIQRFNREVNFYSIVAENGFLLLMSLLYFKELLDNPLEGNILSLSFFWLNCAVLFFYTINILFWISYRFLASHNKGMLHIGFQLDIYSNYVLYIVIGYAFILERRRFKANTAMN